MRVYSACNEIVSDEPDEAARHPAEFINSITPSGMPQNYLSLKEGDIIMLLRNLNR